MDCLRKMKPESKTLINLGKFFLPVILGIGAIGLAGFLLEESLRVKFWPLISAYFFPPLGKETVIPAGVAFGIEPLIMALSVAFVDIIVALFLVWNYDLAKKIPILGRFMQKIEDVGKSSSSKYSWIKPLRFIGIILFVMVPFQGSGGLVGSIVGRFVGMKPWNIFFAISIGAITGCTLIAYFAEAILNVFIQNFLLGLLIIIILIIVGLMFYGYKKTSKNSKKTKK